MAETSQARRLRQFGVTLDALADAMKRMATDGLSDLERAGAVQFYQLSWDLAWKVLRDDLVNRGVTLDVVAPNNVVRAACETGVIDDPDAWVDAGRTRNLLTHTYDSAHVEAALAKVRERFLPMMLAYRAQRRAE